MESFDQALFKSSLKTLLGATILTGSTITLTVSAGSLVVVVHITTRDPTRAAFVASHLDILTARASLSTLSSALGVQIISKAATTTSAIKSVPSTSPTAPGKTVDYIVVEVIASAVVLLVCLCLVGPVRKWRARERATTLLDNDSVVISDGSMQDRTTGKGEVLVELPNLTSHHGSI